MKNTLKTTLILTASLLTIGVLAQAAGRPVRAQASAADTAKPGPRHPHNPVIAALDANKDGEIDATELANAATALKALDANNDGKLTMDEIRPPRREGQGPRGQGPEGARDGKGPHGRGPRDGRGGPAPEGAPAE